uniref:Uncharacterized protein n=1 Tax=Physcomitrium patens TaxID=3218 RepID=A0A2K1J310_PHYPA|nr:hypothetical protein PHYPA_021765 [Physcomitrium patens]
MQQCPLFRHLMLFDANFCMPFRTSTALELAKLWGHLLGSQSLLATQVRQVEDHEANDVIKQMSAYQMLNPRRLFLRLLCSLVRVKTGCVVNLHLSSDLGEHS